MWTLVGCRARGGPAPGRGGSGRRAGPSGAGDAQLPQNKLNLKKARLEGWQISCFLKRAQRTEAFRGQSADIGTSKTQVLEKQLPALGEEAGLPVRQAALLQRGPSRDSRARTRSPLVATSFEKPSLLCFASLSASVVHVFASSPADLLLCCADLPTYLYTDTTGF